MSVQLGESFHAVLRNLLERVRDDVGEHVLVNVLSNHEHVMVFVEQSFNPESSYMLIEGEGTTPIADHEAMGALLQTYPGLFAGISEIAIAHELCYDMDTPSEGVVLVSSA